MLGKVVLALVITLSPGYALADLITFDGFNENPMAAGAHIEGLFTYQVSSGTGFSLLNTIGSPAPSSLVTRGIGGVPPNDFGATVDIFLTAGGLFTFNGFQLACAGSTFGSSFDACDFDAEIVQFIGQSGGSTTLTSGPVSSSSLLTFQPVNPGTLLQFDRLQIRISRAGTGRQALDNINLTPIGVVAEPGTLLLLFSGLAGLTGMRFSRSRKK